MKRYSCGLPLDVLEEGVDRGPDRVRRPSARASPSLPSRISPISASARSVIAATSPSRSVKWRYRIGLLMPPAVAISSIVTSAPSRRITSMAAIEQFAAAAGGGVRASDARWRLGVRPGHGGHLHHRVEHRRRRRHYAGPMTVHEATERATFTAMARGDAGGLGQDHRFGAGVLPRARRSGDRPTCACSTATSAASPSTA